MLVHYDVEVGDDGATLTRHEALTLPGNIQYAWPHPSGRYFYAARIRLSSYHRHCKQQRNPAGNRTELGKRPEIFSLRYGFDDCCWTCLRLGWPLRHLRFGGR